MTVRTLLASALLLGAAALPAQAGGVPEGLLGDVVHGLTWQTTDGCVWFHHHETACIPKGYLPVDVMSYLPPPPTAP